MGESGPRFVRLIFSSHQTKPLRAAPVCPTREKPCNPAWDSVGQRGGRFLYYSAERGGGAGVRASHAVRHPWKEAIVTKTSVRLSPETCKKLENEAAKLGGESGTSVTVSDLIRACIDQKFPQVSAKARKEISLQEHLREELSELKESHAQLSRDVGNLVQALSEAFPKLASREQADALASGLVVVINALKGM